MLGDLKSFEIIAEITGAHKGLNEQKDDIEDVDIITKPRAEVVLKAMIIIVLEDLSLFSTFGEAIIQ